MDTRNTPERGRHDRIRQSPNSLPAMWSLGFPRDAFENRAGEGHEDSVPRL
jgi:hypothetical protein